MKNSPALSQAFTRIDLAVVVAAMGVLSTLFAFALSENVSKAQANRMWCVNNLKQVGLAFRIWANDNKDTFPMQVGAKSGGSQEAIATGETFRHFLVISNECNSTKILVCPSDSRTVQTNFSRLANSNISYFVCLDADETKPQRLLSGDRNLTNGLPTKKGVLEVSVAQPAGWTVQIHVEAGNLGLSDGSAKHVTTAGLRRQIEANQVDGKPAPQRLQFPE